MRSVKFATQIDAQVMRDLRRYAGESNRTISGNVTEAVAEYLQRRRVRPAFRSAMTEVLAENEALLQRLAR